MREYLPALFFYGAQLIDIHTEKAPQTNSTRNIEATTISSAIIVTRWDIWSTNVARRRQIWKGRRKKTKKRPIQKTLVTASNFFSSFDRQEDGAYTRQQGPVRPETY